MERVSWVPRKSVDQVLVEKYLKDSIRSNNFTNGGPNVCRLERFIKERFEIKDKSVICVCNGSSAIQMLCAAIEYVDCLDKKSFKWATQSFTFPPSAQGFLSKSVIVDIDKEGGLDLEQLPKDVDGIIVTNVFGNVVDINKYVVWSNENGKYLVFDNAATAFTLYKGQNSCNYGHGSIISFHHTKPVGFGEGGAIIVDTRYEHAIRRLINFGLDNKRAELMWHREASNHKMSDIAAVFILQHLSNLNQIIEHHCKLYAYFQDKLDTKIHINLYPTHGDGVPFVSCFSLMFLEYDDQVRLRLLENGVFCRKYYKPLNSTPMATQFYRQILCIPCTYDMTEADIDFIFEFL